MSLHIAIQMDPVASINTKLDSTYLLGLEAQRRGYYLYYYEPHQLFLDQGILKATVTDLHFHTDEEHHYTLGESRIINMKTMNIVLMRQDPPFDMNYLTYTYLLESIHPDTFVINHPTEVRNCPEKLFVCQFSELMPPTIITAQLHQAKQFLHTHKKIILKPLYAFGGKDIHYADTLETLQEKFTQLYKKYSTAVMVQLFLPNVQKGDKRIILIDGEISGALNRIPNHPYLSNMALGGTAVKTEITPRDQHICNALRPELKKRSLLLAGIDIIDGFLTEINVTSPTGLRAINRLDNSQLEVKFWDVVEKKYKNRKNYSSESIS